MKSAFSSFKKRVDYAEYGGAPLLGVNGICIICHGRSSPRAIKNAITMAIELTRLQTINFVQKDIAELMSYYRRDNN